MAAPEMLVAGSYGSLHIDACPEGFALTWRASCMTWLSWQAQWASSGPVGLIQPVSPARHSKALPGRAGMHFCLNLVGITQLLGMRFCLCLFRQQKCGVSWLARDL